MKLLFCFLMLYLGFVWSAYALTGVVTKSIFVGQHGQVHFNTVQSAIDSIPEDNREWIRIHVNTGIYNERVIIPRNKEFILLEGEGRNMTTIVSSNVVSIVVEKLRPKPTTRKEKGFSLQQGKGEMHDLTEKNQEIMKITLEDSATFVFEANNIIVKDITFRNDYTKKYGLIKRAVAAAIKGDKTSFYDCGFVSYQDTLYDKSGRHYFSNCYIEGHVDYIFGYGQSIYERCTIYSSSNRISPMGWITAQGRQGSTDSNGFVFKYCNMVGTGHSYLGRAWGPHSKVVFYRSNMDDIIDPQGWDRWMQPSSRKLEYYEYECTGLGSNLGSRVNWLKTLSYSDIHLFCGNGFIDNEGWVDKQP